LITYIKKYPEYLLLVLFAVISIFTVNAYGYAWDESDQRDIGITCYNYVFNNDLSYRTLMARDHGPVFEFLLVLVEKSLHQTNFRDIYVTRHLVSHLFFLLSALYFYKLIFFLYNNKKLALLGFFLLVINPSIYGHSFFNSKDVPFLAMLIICFYQFAIAFKFKKNYQFILLALFCSLLINIRIMGILFFAFVLFFLVWDIFVFRKENKSVFKHLLLIAIFSITTVVFTIATWPLLWEKPLDNFLYAIDNLSKYPFPGTILFNGAMLTGQELSWNYIPVWFVINTPIVYLLLGGLGILIFCKNSLKKLIKVDLAGIDKNNLLFIFSFFAPVLVVIVLHSVLYDSWRHLFYIYPAFILLAIYFISMVIKTKHKSFVFAFTLISISATSFFMISNFPFYHVYFNPTMSFHESEYLRKNYDLDYWGVSYNKALEYILENDKKDTILIAGPNPPASQNVYMLPDKDQKRFVFVGYNEHPDYYITNYRGHPEDYDPNELEEVKSFSVLNNKINTVFKFKK